MMMDGAGRFDNIHGDEDEVQLMRKDVIYDIRIDWNYDRQEYVAYFDGYCGAVDSDSTLGFGETPSEAAIDLIENANKRELQEDD